jgi:hypothetical protein
MNWIAWGPRAEETGEGEADHEETFEVTGMPNDPQHIWNNQSEPWIFLEQQFQFLTYW